MESETSDSRLIDEKNLQNCADGNIKETMTPAEQENLYCEILYTLKHKIGRTADGHSAYIDDLYKHAQESFKVSSEEHNRLQALVSDEKVLKSAFLLILLRIFVVAT